MSNEKLTAVLKKYQSTFEPVVAFNPNEQRLLSLDLSAGNEALANINEHNLATFVQWAMDASRAKYAIGGYLENRRLYQHSSLFDSNATANIPEPRTIHLGIDIWGPAGTEIFAPLAGNIHSFAYNDNIGDYGATIILQHELDGIRFHTLYGHLSLADLDGLEVGQPVNAGNVFAHFGPPAENGNWPPHLHFQIISDMQEKLGDYPGVCAASQLDYYQENCPNADLILMLLQWAK